MAAFKISSRGSWLMLEKVSLDNLESSLLETKEVGTIKEIKKAIASVVGLPSCLYGQMVHLPNDLKGMVIGFDEEEVMVLVLGDERSEERRVGKECRSR